jgi:Dolichyl-phosphate-mannose-protein mannosyltransferase
MTPRFMRECHLENGVRVIEHTSGPGPAKGKLLPPALRFRGVPLLFVAIGAAYLSALFYARDRIPAGLNNDTAQEALRGIYLVEGRHFEVITFALGNSAETLYLYLLGASVQLFGPTTLAIQVCSWLSALLCIWLIWELVKRIDETVPDWVSLTTAACSLWLFHYARSGLRAICAPIFLAAFALLLDRAERRPSDRIAGLVCGGALGLSIYGYTSCRVLPFAFAVYVGVRLLRERHNRATLMKRYGIIVAGALGASIPNILFFLRQPREFLLRGNYVMRGKGIGNAIWSALLPWHYPDTFRRLAGPNHYFDGVSAGLGSSGLNPIPIVFAAAILLGLWRSRRWIEKTLIWFLLAAWVVALATLGTAGPSLTRFLILLPVYLVFTALGFGSIVGCRPQLRIPVLLVILGVGFSEGYQYLSERGAAPEYYAAAATPIGKTAAKLASHGHKVVCVVSRDANVVHFLTHRHRSRVKVVEFYGRPLDPAQIPLSEFRPDIMLLENGAGDPSFDSFTSRLPADWRVARNERFSIVQFPAW